MDNQGLMMEGYRAAPDRSVAFDTLAAGLVMKKNEKALATLLGEHERDHAADPSCIYYRGEWHMLRGETEKAGSLFAEALKKAGPSDQWRFRNGLFRARVKSGQAVATYREIEPRNRTFADLVPICVQEKAADQLQALLDTYRKDNPDDSETAEWDLQLRWLKQDYEGVLKLLREHGKDFFDLPRHWWQADNYRVRSLVKLMRNDEAIQAAETAVKRHGDRMLLVLAHAAAGDVKRTIADLEQAKSASYFVGDCYRDDDLGPILRSEAFRTFRDRFPEPK
jgi:tetratricopeptide (TPR) repeat protein